MSKETIAAVYRSQTYSPNNVNNDAAILNAVAENLKIAGYDVNFYNEDRLLAGDVKERVVVNMCRRRESILALQALEDAGALVINSGYGIENCTRERMTRLFEEKDVAQPESLIVSTDSNIKDILDKNGFGNCWVKRGDGHSVHKEDVSYVRHSEEAQEILTEYRMRGINRAVINKHLAGDLVKFYGVRDSDFFFKFYPFESGHSKWGQEAQNGPSHRYPYDEKALYDECQRASEILDVAVFGGDCIVSADGQVRIIDFNDWPSFAPCRAEAAKAIANYIISAIDARFCK